MTADAPRRPIRPSIPVATRTAITMLAGAATLAAMASLLVACAPPRDTGAPTPRPTLAITTPLNQTSRRS
jgi:hypothetical protein